VIINGDSLEVLKKLPIGKIKSLFADIPDNLGMDYQGYEDRMRPEDYYRWVQLLILEALPKCQVFWLTYFPGHDTEITWMVRDIVKYRHPSFSISKFLWRYTFSQYNANDCALGFRPLMRFKRTDAVIYPEEIMVVSARQLLGDARANSEGRVPDNVWNFPRVTGNSWQRVDFMPTQLPIELLERVIKFTCGPLDTFIDLFGGSGSSLMAASKLGRLNKTHVVELDMRTCECIQKRESLKGVPLVKFDESFSFKD
jgi:site-specific DNA-methyltransferase (adenine-specific)